MNNLLKAKLVRDKVEPRDQHEEVHSANSSAGRHMALCLKMHEEASEIADEPQDAYEYADLLEVIFELARMHGVSNDDIMNAMADKRHRKGGFRMARIWQMYRPTNVRET